MGYSVPKYRSEDCWWGGENQGSNLDAVNKGVVESIVFPDKEPAGGEKSDNQTGNKDNNNLFSDEN